MEKLTKGQRTRKRILDTAIELFATNGFEATSFREIGDECDMSQQGVMGHFKTKDELFFGVVDRIKEETYYLVEKFKDPKDNAFELLLKHHKVQLELVSKHPTFMQMFILMYYYSSFKPHVQKFYSEIAKYARSQYEAYLHAGIRENAFEFSCTVEEMAELLHDGMQSNMIHLLIDKKRGAKKHSAKKWEEFVRQLTNYQS